MMTKTEVMIRQAIDSDAQAMAACVDAAYRRYIPIIGKPPSPMLKDYAAVIRDQQAYVAEYQGQIVGVLALIPRPDHMLLDNIAVHPDLQGQGIGKRLMILSEQEAMRQGFDHIQLYTHELMVENIALYEKAGYVASDRRTEMGYKRVYMRKPLTRNQNRPPRPITKS